MSPITPTDVTRVSTGYHAEPGRSYSLRAEAYTDDQWAAADRQAIFARSWQLVCHVSAVAEPGAYVAATVASMPIAVVRDQHGTLRAFYNVCKHRAHEILQGSGTTRALVCPYHAWTFDLTGRLKAARHTDHMDDFRRESVCLDTVQVEEFGG